MMKRIDALYSARTPGTAFRDRSTPVLAESGARHAP
jgi:hypothetical protein